MIKFILSFNIGKFKKTLNTFLILSILNYKINLHSILIILEGKFIFSSNVGIKKYI